MISILMFIVSVYSQPALSLVGGTAQATGTPVPTVTATPDCNVDEKGLPVEVGDPVCTTSPTPTPPGGTPVSILQNAAPDTDTWDQSACGNLKCCDSITIHCDPNCVQSMTNRCVISIYFEQCVALGYVPGNAPRKPTDVPKKNKDVQIPDKFPDNADIRKAKALCSMAHEGSHTRDCIDQCPVPPGKKCPACGSEIVAAQVSIDCLTKAKAQFCGTPPKWPSKDCTALEDEIHDYAMNKAYQACLCQNLAPGEGQKYKSGTCDKCSRVIMGAPDADRWEKMYCKPFEQP
jgi:hypothetical protein